MFFHASGSVEPVRRATPRHARMIGPQGFGKTVLGAYLIAERKCNTLVLVHRKELLDQWVSRLSLFLGIEPKEIGKVGLARINQTADWMSR